MTSRPGPPRGEGAECRFPIVRHLSTMIAKIPSICPSRQGPPSMRFGNHKAPWGPASAAMIDAMDVLPRDGQPAASPAEARLPADTSSGRSLFQRAWWLDAATDGRWQEVSAGGSPECCAWLPIYRVRRRFGRQAIDMPPLTHTRGPVFRLPPGKPTSQMTEGGKLLKGLIEALPPHDEFINVLDGTIDDAYAFVMNGFEVSLSYTCLIDPELDAAACWKAMTDKARNVIRKGERGFALVADIDIASFVAFYELNLHRRKLVSWHDSSAYFRIYDAAKARDAIKLLAVRRPSGALAAAIMLVWADRRMCYLQSP